MQQAFLLAQDLTCLLAKNKLGVGTWILLKSASRLINGLAATAPVKVDSLLSILKIDHYPGEARLLWSNYRGGLLQ